MVCAWYMNSNDQSEDARSERHLDPPRFVALEQLKASTGVLYWKIDADKYESDPKFAQIRSQRGYTYSDEVEISRTTLADYDAKLRMFFTEHLHADEEIRFVIGGQGYFDVRDVANDSWIRIFVQKSDMLVLPAGCYHRFTPDHSDYIKVIRLFVGEPVWAAINRPADQHPARIEYLKSF